MPLLTLWLLKEEGGIPDEYGELSCDEGETFFTFREKLNAWHMFDFAFDFWNLRLAKRMVKALERGNRIVDHGFQVTVIPSVDSGTHCSRQVALVSTVGKGCGIAEAISGTVPSAAPTVGMEQHNITQSIGTHAVDSDWMNDIACERLEGVSQSIRISSDASNEVDVIGITPLDTPLSSCEQESTVNKHVEFESQLMEVQMVKFWSTCIRKLETHMLVKKYEDHSWVVKTWDVEGKAQACLKCLECNTTISGSSKGVMDKLSVTACFNSFKNSHLKTDKHHTNWCDNRKLPVLSEDSRKKARASCEDDRTLVNQGLEIMERVNTDEGGKKKVFMVVGDLGREPCYSFYYKAECTYCGVKFTLVPQQRNLEHNLREHVVSGKHRAAVEESSGKGKGIAILTGNAGRPSKLDNRDVKQRSIHTFFGHDLGRSDHSSSAKGDVQPDLCFTALCWGLWVETVHTNGVSRPVKGLLDDQLRGKAWWCEPHVEIVVFNPVSGSVQFVKGTFRHRDCSRVSRLGGGFVNLTCEQCHSIPLQTDFRLRVLREDQAIVKRGERGSSAGCRLDYLTNSELAAQARSYAIKGSQQRKKLRRLLGRICMLEAKVPNLRELVGEAANRKDILKFCTTIVQAHQRGTFGGRTAVWDFLKDIVFNLNVPKEGKRYNKGTKVLCQALYHHGGCRVIDCLSMNCIGPSINTLQRDRRGMTYFRAGFHIFQFQLISKVLSKAKEKLGITGDVPCILAEDETSIKTSVRWMAKTDVLTGFCGTKQIKHECDVGLEVVVGNGELGFEKIMSSFSDCTIGHYARVIIVNPLHKDLPRMCIMATSTCNSFRSPWVRRQWDQLGAMWNEFCRKDVGPMIGHASDGDPRRRKLMLEDYRGEGISNPRFVLGWIGWMLTFAFMRNGDAFGLHDQDFIHNLKKLINPLDSPIRVLHIGNCIITLEHLELVYELCTALQHGLNRDDLSRTDRQNWASAQRLCNRKLLACLKMVRERKDARIEMTQGTEIYLSICGDYLDIFLNVRLTLRERVILCSKVSFFFRLWRLWLTEGNDTVGGNRQPLTLDNMISMEAFHDIQISCHFVVLLITLFRDKYPYLPVPLHLTGSDCCEQFFSKIGGMKGHERNYDFAEMVDGASSLNRLAELEMHEGLVSVGKSHKKYKNVWMKLNPLIDGECEADLSDFTGLFTNAMIIDALKQGFAEAQNLCITLEMCPSTSASAAKKVWWESPWLKEVELGYEKEACMEDGGDGMDYELPNQNASIHVEEIQRPPLPTVGSSDCDFDDGISDLVVAEGELRHVLSDLFANVENDITESLVVFPQEKPVIDPTIQFDGNVMYKSTLVSQILGNPKLSKDRLTKVRQSMYFNNLVCKPKEREGELTMMMRAGCDVGVWFLETVAPGKTRASTSKKRKTPGSKPVSGQQPLRRLAEKMTWWVGRVQKVRKRYTKTWGRSREQVDLLNRPVGRIDRPDESPCDVLCNWFTPMASRGKFKYTTCDPQWVTLDTVISTVSLTVSPQNPSVFTLDPVDLRRLDEFIKARM